HQARALLLSDGLRVGEAAARVGYESVSHFVRDFKAYFGASPATYTRRYRPASEAIAGSGNRTAARGLAEDIRGQENSRNTIRRTGDGPLRTVLHAKEISGMDSKNNVRRRRLGLELLAVTVALAGGCGSDGNEPSLPATVTQLELPGDRYYPESLTVTPE